MRILHTSDWHLGQNFYSKSRAAEHDAFLTWLLATAEEHLVDAIIVAGDIFDTGSPPSYARELYNRFVVKLQQTGCHLVVLAGNHDSVATLNESKDILAWLKTTVVASAGSAPFYLPLRDGSPGAVFCPVPFLRPRDIMTSQAGLSGQEKQLHLLQAITDYYQQQYQAACELRGDSVLPIIASGHLTTVGASKSDAVRDIYIGTLDAFPAQNFPPADYIALGHIHRPQKPGGQEHIRYCGSPIALSFDETGNSKYVNLVTFSAGKLADVTALEVPVTQQLAVIKGDLESIRQQLEQWRGSPTDAPVWLDIEIATEDYLSNMQRKIQALTADLPVEVLLVRRSREQRERILAGERRETLSELKVEEVFARRLAQEELDDIQIARLQSLFSETLHSLNQEHDA
ncbi:exonuclease subunit SbcD [Phytobacter diazotrophicus]|jgi:exonuclease SbcD|uniref:exonuclease subunit SbcD n=1 Tax=Phytobacter diazotrophicus TaxID=395631 RepID=UPI000892C0CE|nr:exonuclease subunit SbcD [Phytobacter diazotrophicus]AUU89606.1 exonuclease subunit SbcD [Enterobacteriaceae bacterium ENNIH3]AUV10345.1 exonuclease subunit SbcD [Enterobacteriaceae bacterium ENNIH2]MDU4151428.1 exonuclease subunit SbcD [Enterobacteriaceae bacterium]PTA94864.1 exonuclease subunit SbcD [Kluyvera sp. Nf5]PWF51921.1 exonuclease subunit SbcD [[Kluyvera] intestini]